MIFVIFYSILMVTHTTICSLVIEPGEDMHDLCSDLDYKKYCLPLGDCPAGSHVMCMYYKRNRLMGPHCIDGRMVRMTPDTKQLILDKINGVRSEIANGIAKGENDINLPRGYGLYRLMWDNRLAIFAQVWANQCRFTRDDQCRATKRFDNPGQFLGTFRYTIPEWRKQDDINRTEPLSKQCLTESKVKYAIDSSIDVLLIERYWATSEHVLKHNITNPHNNYLLMAYGKTTHVGCGMSAYKDYHWSEDLNQYEFYYLQLVCNLSAQPVDGEPVYETEPPLPSKNLTANCGCPQHFLEDEDCLCVHHLDMINKENTASTTETTEFPNSSTSTESASTADTNNTFSTEKPSSDGDVKKDSTTTKTTLRPNSLTTSSGDKVFKNQFEMSGSEKPTILILPIITVEDAPEDVRQLPWKSDITAAQGKTRKQFSSENNLYDTEKQRIESHNMSYLPSLDYENSQDTNQSTQNDESLRFYNNSDNFLQSYQNKGNLASGNNSSQNLTTSYSRKNSLFSRVAPFDLSSQNHNKKYNKRPLYGVSLKNNLKTFLTKVPKKDISRLEELLLKLIIEKQSQKEDQQNNVGANSMPSSYIRPVISFQAANTIIPKQQRFVTKELKYHNRRNRNLVDNMGNIDEEDKKNVPIKISDGVRVFETQSQFDMPVIRKQNPLVTSKNKYDSSILKADLKKKPINSALVQFEEGWRNDVRAIANVGKNFDSKTREIEEHKVNNINSVTADNLKLKRTLYLHHEINKLKSKLKHLRQYAHQNSVVDERFRPIVTSQNERRDTKVEDSKNVYLPDRDSVHDF